VIGQTPVGGARLVQTRRQLLGGATLLAAGGSLAVSPAPAWAGSPIDSMESAVVLEQMMAVAYESLASRRGVDRASRDLFGLLAGHEHKQAAALVALAEYLGGPPPPLPTVAAAERLFPGLAAANDRRSALRLAEQLENAEIFAFFGAIGTLSDIKLVELVTAVMCSDAQHLALVRQAAHEDPIPAAFLAGKQSG
jgi:hypothetical protein